MLMNKFIFIIFSVDGDLLNRNLIKVISILFIQYFYQEQKFRMRCICICGVKADEKKMNVFRMRKLRETFKSLRINNIN